MEGAEEIAKLREENARLRKRNGNLEKENKEKNSKIIKLKRFLGLFLDQVEELEQQQKSSKRKGKTLERKLKGTMARSNRYQRIARQRLELIEKLKLEKANAAKAEANKWKARNFLEMGMEHVAIGMNIGRAAQGLLAIADHMNQVHINPR